LGDDMKFIVSSPLGFSAIYPFVVYNIIANLSYSNSHTHTHTHTHTEKYVYQPTAESLSQPAVTWHIM